MEVVCLFAVSSVPLTAFAGFFDFVTHLFADEITEEVSAHNLQNMPLLQAVPNPDFDNHIDLSIVDESVLEASVGPLGTPIEIEEQSMSDKVIVYTVRQGDSVASLAKMFGVSQNTIIWANDGKKVLKERDELVILPVSGIEYTIKKGDTLASIAKKSNADADEIARFNDLGEKLVLGEKIIIPNGEIATAPSKQPSGIKGTAKVPSGLSVGYFIRPTSGRLTQGLHGKYGTGVDIANKIGTPIVAAASGKVIVSKSGGYNGGWGSYIVIEHNNGTQTLYAHLSHNSVFSGAYVNQGDSIGLMGNTGKATGSHLHVEVLGQGIRYWSPFLGV